MSTQILIEHKTLIINTLLILLGTLFPIFIGAILPRRKTIGYGRLIYKFFKVALAQKRIHIIPSTLVQNIIITLRATFVDISYGIYIESRTDLTPEEQEKKIDEYIQTTIKDE